MHSLEVVASVFGNPEISSSARALLDRLTCIYYLHIYLYAHTRETGLFHETIFT